MAAEEEFDRVGVRSGGDYRTETGRNGSFREDSLSHDPKPGTTAREPVLSSEQPSRGGSPLPTGLTGRPLSGRSDRANMNPVGRALSVSSPTEADTSSGMQWAMGFFKQALPFVQKLLPLLDGQIASAAANLLLRPHTPPSPPPVNLQPIENSVAELQVEQRALRDQVADQNVSLKRVEDHLQMVREATDRNTLEQQELIEDLKGISSRMNLLALLFLGLLVISVLLNLFLFLHIQRVLP